jgi:hypothetical protein
MTATNTVRAGASVWAVATRITPLDSAGNLVPGSNSFVTSTLIKATLTPVYEKGDEVAIKNAAGDLEVYAKHGDINKWFTAAIDLALPDPDLEQVLTGGVVFNDSTAALGAPSVPVVTTQSTGGRITAGTSYYSEAGYSVYGRTANSALVSIATTGSTSANVIAPSFISGALGAVVYGRGIGSGYQQEIGRVQNFTGQTTSGATVGTVTSVAVTALTKAIDAGQQFTIVGDTNVPPVVFTVNETATLGQTLVSVDSVNVATSIAAAGITPVLLDTGIVTPSGLPNSTDMSAGPGNNVGFQLSAMGLVGNPDGVAIEMWQRRIINGVQASDYPYWWHVWPKVANLHVMARDFTNANLANMYEGDAFENPNFGSGPNGDWPFDSTKAYQRAVCGADVVPTPSYAPLSAGY